MVSKMPMMTWEELQKRKRNKRSGLEDAKDYKVPNEAGTLAQS